MWTVRTNLVGNRTSRVESSANGVDERPAKVGELGSTVDVAARRRPEPFHNM
jgi:hypothetical protein